MGVRGHCDTPEWFPQPWPVILGYWVYCLPFLLCFFKCQFSILNLAQKFRNCTVEGVPSVPGVPGVPGVLLLLRRLPTDKLIRGIILLKVAFKIWVTKTTHMISPPELPFPFPEKRISFRIKFDKLPLQLPRKRFLNSIGNFFGNNGNWVFLVAPIPSQPNLRQKTSLQRMCFPSVSL